MITYAKFVTDTIGLFAKTDIINSCSGISLTTVEKVLGEMRRENTIKTVGSGCRTKWCKTDQ